MFYISFFYIFCSCLLLLSSCIHIVPFSNLTFSSRLFLRAMVSQQNGKDDSGEVEGNLSPNHNNSDTSMDFEFQSQLLADLQQEAFPNNRKRSADDPAMNSICKTSKVVSTENNGTNSSPSTPSALMSNRSPHHPEPNTNILSGRLLKNRYPDEIAGPYIVLLQPTILNKDTPRMNATNTGRFLFRIFKNNEIINISSSGIQQVTVTLYSAQYANTLVELPDLPLKKLVAFIPNSSLSYDGIIREVPLDIPDAEILGSIIFPIRVQSVERQNRKITENGASKLIPTQSIRIIFEGPAHPAYIFLFSVHHSVLPWFPPVKMCFNCFLFGHISEHCKSQAKCIRCGKKKHPEGLPHLF